MSRTTRQLNASDAGTTCSAGFFLAIVHICNATVVAVDAMHIAKIAESGSSLGDSGGEGGSHSVVEPCDALASQSGA